jgi:hypothetical protein
MAILGLSKRQPPWKAVLAAEPRHGFQIDWVVAGVLIATVRVTVEKVIHAKITKIKLHQDAP